MSGSIWSAAAGPDDAPPLVLVHGSLDRSAGLLRLSRRLDERFRVIRYDRRGYGRSVPHVGPFDMSRQLDDLATVIDVNVGDAEPLVLIGHSYGGNVALAHAAVHSERVSAVVTYESPMSWEPWWPQGSAGSRAISWADDPEGAAEAFLRSLIGDERWERLPPSTRSARRSEGPAMLGELEDLRRAAPWEAAAVTAPVLAMHGEHARHHHRSASELLGEVLSDAEVAEIEGAGHFGPNTHADAVARRIVRFLDRHGTPTAGG